MIELPLEVWTQITLEITDIKELYYLCRTMKYLYLNLYQSRKFRLQWLSKRYPQYIDFIYTTGKKDVILTDLRPTSSSAELSHFVTEPAFFLADATRLRIRLPHTVLRAHFVVWLYELEGHVVEMPIEPGCFENRQVIPNLMIYGWHEAIPWFLRNQLVPPPLNSEPADSEWVVVSPPDPQGLQSVGPDFEKTWRWFDVYCAGDPDYYEYYRESWQMLGKSEHAILSTGFFDFKKYDPSFFPDGWEKGLVYMVFNELPAMWQRWIQHHAKDTEWKFDLKGMEGCRRDLLKFLGL